MSGVFHCKYLPHLSSHKVAQSSLQSTGFGIPSVIYCPGLVCPNLRRLDYGYLRRTAVGGGYDGHLGILAKVPSIDRGEEGWKRRAYINFSYTRTTTLLAQLLTTATVG